MFDAVLNMPACINSDYTADITRCYENIPLEGAGSLVCALRWLTDLVWKAQAQALGSTVGSLVISFTWDIARASPAGLVRWGRGKRRGDRRFIRLRFSQARLLTLMRWLIQNAVVQLGDRAWRQMVGIAMGLPCSPDWCNIYLLYYEWQFLERLVMLEQFHLLTLFQFWFQYIDDVRVINNPIISRFLDPTQPRVPSNPYWIYPLHILEIKPTVEAFSVGMFGEERVPIGVHTTFLHFECNLVLPGVAGGYEFRRRNKALALDFPVALFIRYFSNRPPVAVLNVAISHLVPYLYISSTRQFAETSLNELVSCLVRNGVPRVQLLRKLRKFITLQANNFPGF